MRIEGDREQLMREGDESWVELCAVLDAAEPGVPLHDPDSPQWTSRDVYTHFIRMHSGSARAIRWEIEHGERYVFSVLDEDELNERNVAQDRSIDLDESSRLARESRDVYRALVTRLTEEQFEAIGRRHGDDLLGGHYRGHLTYIREAG